MMLNDFCPKGAVTLEHTINQVGLRLYPEWTEQEYCEDNISYFHNNEDEEILSMLRYSAKRLLTNRIPYFDFERAIYRGFDTPVELKDRDEFLLINPYENYKNAENATLDYLLSQHGLKRSYFGILKIPILADYTELFLTKEEIKQAVTSTHYLPILFKKLNADKPKLLKVFNWLRSELYASSLSCCFFTDDGEKINFSKKYWASKEGWHIFTYDEWRLSREEFNPLYFDEKQLNEALSKLVTKETRPPLLLKSEETPKEIIAESLKNKPAKSKAGRPASQLNSAKQILLQLLPNGIPESCTHTELLSHVNRSLKEQGLHPVSVDTIKRAREKLPTL